jgi:flagellin
MISLQTNVDSLTAQSNLNVDNQFQSKTIQQLTSGYRINSSGDDAAGLAVANGLRDNIAELNQGVNNANDGVSQLQIVDGGLSNISTILDRMKTLATESASGTFTGNRATLDQEYQGLVSEITRQASNINLNAGGSFNTNLSIYIGGANSSANANVSVNLSGAQNAVDAVSLGLSGTSVQGGGTSFSGTPATNLNDPNALFNVGNPATQGENFSVSYTNSAGQVQTSTVSVAAATAGMNGSTFVNNLNTALTNAGITGVTAQIGSDGTLQFSGGNLLEVTHNNNGASSLVAADGASLINGNNYSSTGSFTAFTDGVGGAAGHTTESMTITAGGQNYNVTLTSDTTNASERADTLAHAVASLNTQLQGSGVTAVANGTQITLQSAGSFTVSETANTPGAGTTPGAGSFYGTTPGAQTVSAPTADAGSTGNADSAIAKINSAIQNLGLVQGRVGAGENLLQYAINLAQSQITNFSSAESAIRDADVASDAANLTKSQVLTQTAIAAMAQANSEPQAVLKLLQ